MRSLIELKRGFQRRAHRKKAQDLQRFFKTGRNDYGYGDKFLGVTVPQQRVVAKKYRDLPLAEVLKLLKSPYHEHRLTALFILNSQFAKGNETVRERIAKSYLQNTKYINNWDLVDSSAPHILGSYLLDKPRTILYALAKSKFLWERRIAILATQTFIRHGQLNDTFTLAIILLHDRHDLLHKAVGWMLREAGQKDPRHLRMFLNEHAAKMPRTMLRYAIEKFPPRERRTYLQKR